MFTLGFGPLSTVEVLVILVIALLLFGKRLPEVGKSLGKGIIEFKKGLAGIDEDVQQAGSRPAPRYDRQIDEPREYRQPLPEGGGERRVSRSDDVEAPAPKGQAPQQG